MGTLVALRFFHSLIGGKQNDLNEENMNTLSYHIVIKTHARYRVGDLSVDLEDEKVGGTIHAPFFEPRFSGKMNDDGTLSLNLTVNAEEKPEDCESTGHISMYAIHISVPAAVFTYEIDGISSRTSIR